ncbi:MAG: TrkA family potassium uptake protein [Saprospiraceae bacterium]|nr:TrkA family potassium uptake protein [Saprospiraceae bacterium]
MKYIIIGIGNFGLALSEKLMLLGHEVVAVDKRMEKVDLIKDRVTLSLAMDTTDKSAVESLPLRDADVVIVAIGEEEGPSLLTVAILKELQIKRIVARTLSPVHSTILHAMGVQEIINPEEEAADRLARRLIIKGVIDSFYLSDRFNIVEIKVPDKYVGKTLHDIDVRHNHRVLVLTIIRYKKLKNALGGEAVKRSVLGVVDIQTVLEEDDILVMFGDMKHIAQFGVY